MPVMNWLMNRSIQARVQWKWGLQYVRGADVDSCCFSVALFGCRKFIASRVNSISKRISGYHWTQCQPIPWVGKDWYNGLSAGREQGLSPMLMPLMGQWANNVFLPVAPLVALGKKLVTYCHNAPHMFYRSVSFSNVSPPVQTAAR